jgi:hypothetical protein
MQVKAKLCLDVMASSEDEAQTIVAELCDRLYEQGAAVPNCDLEDMLKNASCYPELEADADTYGIEVLDATDEEGEDEA